MPTINFSQFATSLPTTGWSPENNYLVGYATINGQNVEQKYQMSTLVSESLPGAGLGTKLHQIRKLAKRTAETTLCMAAITKREEVICWGQNFKIPLAVAPKLKQENLYTKFGAGFNANVTSRAAVWQPVVIPFYSGTPNPEDNSVDIIDLQKEGLTIVDLHWNEHYAIALLSDGTVWYKGFIGPTTNTGLGADIGNLPEADSYFTSGFFEIRKLREKTNNLDSNLVPMGKRIVKIMSLPVDLAPQWGGLFCAVADDKIPTTLEAMTGPIYVWGNMPGEIGSKAQTLPTAGKASSNSTDIRRLGDPGWQKPTAPGLSEPSDITSGIDIFTGRRFRDVKLSGGGWAATGIRTLTNATVQVIDDWGRLWSLGSNKYGICGTGTNMSTALNHHTNWAQAFWHQDFNATDLLKQDPTPPPALIGATASQPNLPGAKKFLSLGLQNHVSGFISTTFTIAGQNVNRIYLSGTNREIGQSAQLIYINSNATNWVNTSVNKDNTQNRSNNIFRAYAQSEADNLFIKGVITNELNCIVITQKGQVWAAGDGRTGGLGRTLPPPIPKISGAVFVGPTFAKVAYKNKNNSTSSIFGSTGAVSAVDIYWDDTAFVNGCVGIKVLNNPTNLGYDVYFAGSKTFANINQSFGFGTNLIDYTFRCFPISDGLSPGVDLDDVAIGGFPDGHLWTIILTKSGRTWGVGRGNHDFLFSTEPWGWTVWWRDWKHGYAWTSSSVYTEYETPIPQLIF